MVVDGSSKSKKSKKNNNGGANNATGNANSKTILDANIAQTEKPQSQPHQNETININNTNSKPRRSIDYTNELKERSTEALLLEASMTPLNQDAMDDEADEEAYDASVNERLHEIDLNLVSDASDENGSESSSPALTDNEHLNVKMNNLTIRSDLMQIQRSPKLNQQFDNQYNSSSKNSYSNNIKQQQASQEQLLDNTAIQHLVSEQTKSHLILDDAELLQCKNSAEFVALFRNKLLAQASASEDSSGGSRLNGQESHNGTLGDNQRNNNSYNPKDTSPQLSPNSQLIEDKLVKCVSIFGKLNC